MIDLRPIVLGVCSALFFAVTFVLNRRMELAGGSWAWSASLRYLFTLPFLLAIVAGRGKLRPLLAAMRERPGAWLLWGTVGFGLFYAPICFAAAYAPGWLTAGTWQITIISGSLLAPFFGQWINGPSGIPQYIRGKIPLRGLLLSLIILAGVALLQAEHARELAPSQVWLGILPVLIASFAYPLGNRKTMELCGDKLDVFQRILGMTLASLPFWLLLSLYGLADAGLPSSSQVGQSVIVALSSGIVATVLFFRATDLVRSSMSGLAAVEATQSLEVLFALLGEMLILASPLPSLLSWAGIAVIIAGMALHSLFSQHSGGAAPDREKR
ncbi:multidrug resistance efflux transporter family protein [Paenibacillus sp. MMS20-IR301]|uniref:DMT family transporter n=1 Tax=Paenibacillus sp. MMS20-IR301 TaxID=2895946 RepID=UPI0028E6DFE1|nr:multidrug resistance efflux transporter family protein [Paenibacillus sp. MMS20-IR301]WNS41231.1 multidrug resistance efflux transporter family protein [Paenibacillus sp. MMS20-IR301]